MSKLIKGIHHVALTPTPANYDKTVHFYTAVLGMEPVRSWGEGDHRAVMVSTGDNSVMEIMSTGKSDVLPEGPYPHVAFETDAVDELVELVRKEGYEITTEPKDVDIPAEPVYAVRVAFCKGPAGEIIEFFHVK